MISQNTDYVDSEDKRHDGSDNCSKESEANRKLFIGGLSWQTTEDSLKEYFEGLGYCIEKVQIMRDQVTGRSRGFGFITLVNLSDVDKVVSANLYLGRKIEAKRAISKQDMDNSSRKFFVGGIPINLTITQFREYFQRFGNILDAQIITERTSGASRGFGFITFDSDEAAHNVQKISHIIQGKKIEIKKAQPKNQPIYGYPVPFTEYPIFTPVPIFSPVVYPAMAGPYLIPQGGFICSPYMEPQLVHNITGRTSISKINDGPALIRTKQFAANKQRPSVIYLVNSERKERASSAAPGIMANTRNTRNRGMSHPPAGGSKPTKSVYRAVHNSYFDS